MTQGAKVTGQETERVANFQHHFTKQIHLLKKLRKRLNQRVKNNFEKKKNVRYFKLHISIYIRYISYGIIKVSVT